MAYGKGNPGGKYPCKPAWAGLTALLVLAQLPMTASASLVVWGNGAGYSIGLLQSFDLETGAKLDEFWAPGAGQNQYWDVDVGRGITAVGNDVFYTTSGSGKVFKTDATTHRDMGTLFDTGLKSIRSLSFDGSTFWIQSYDNRELRRYKPDGTLLFSIPDFTSPFDVWENRILAEDATGFGLFNFDGILVKHLFDASFPGDTRWGLAFDGSNISVEMAANRINTYSLGGELIHSTFLYQPPGPTYDDRVYTDLSFVRSYPKSVPEPASLALFAMGLALMLGYAAQGRKPKKADGV